MQNRLTAAGIRPINNVVDITNYVMLEYGQPLHAFDAANVKDGEIIVRQAKPGEQVVTLDDQERKLQEGMLLITDPEKVIAIAGVMGAANSEVTEQTKDIILESAYFAGSSVRLTSKELGLRSEASTRFEKGVDPERVHAALDRAASLLAELAGGKVLKGIAEQREDLYERKEIPLTVFQLNKVLGTNPTLMRLQRERKRGESSEEIGAHETELGPPEGEDDESDRDPAGPVHERVARGPAGRDREAVAGAATPASAPRRERARIGTASR